MRFWELLNNGTITKQSPDGQEIIASMKRAIVSDDKVEWLETCFCNPPLSHERATIYDHFFQNMEIRPADTKAQLKGERFWDYLQANSQRQSLSVGALANHNQIRYVPLRIL